MLRDMRITGLGVIDDALLELTPGLNVITGETGAGKTMVVSGLGLLLGARADSGLVRSGSSVLSVEGCVDLPDGHPALLRAADAGGDATDGLVLVRTVNADGRSRAIVGGRTAPVGVLSELGTMLVAVHGQADQWRLRRPEEHRVLLDQFGGEAVATPLAAYTESYLRVASLREELDRFRALMRDRAQEAEVLRVGLERIEAVAPQPGEDIELRAEEERLAHSDGLRAAAASAHEVLVGPDDGGGDGDGVVDALALARLALTRESDADPQLVGLEARVAELGYLATDLASDLAAYLTGIDADPARLAWIQERRAELSRLTRAYGDTVDEVLAWSQRAVVRLTELDGADDRAQELASDLDDAVTTLGRCAAQVSSARSSAARALGEAVTRELGTLAMGSAVVEVEVTTRSDPDGLVVPGEESPRRYGPAGIDDVELRLAANPGAAGRSVSKAASGGELSRVMLAIEVVTAGSTGTGASSEVPTFVFDEVDAGVGGEAALSIGSRLAALSASAQVIVVTHLPQVAAYADRHLVVRKASDGHVTRSDVQVLTDDEQIAELARMMAGVDTPAAREHARDLLATAAADRAGPTPAAVKKRDTRGRSRRTQAGS